MINKKKGFIALISAIIISVILLTITFTVGMSGIFGQFNVLDSESKERSISLAEACVDSAVLDYNTNGTVASQYTVNSVICHIKSWSASTPNLTIITQAIVNKAYTNIKAVINTDTSTISSWEECANETSC